MPTTSMAGDCANTVTEGDEDSESLINGILCMQDLRQTLLQVSSIDT